MKNFLYLLCFFTLPVSALSLDSFLTYLRKETLTQAKDLSQENHELFESLTCQFENKEHKLKAKKSDLLQKSILGYDQALLSPYVNVVFLNDSYLNEFTREEKKFLMAREIALSMSSSGRMSDLYITYVTLLSLYIYYHLITSQYNIEALLLTKLLTDLVRARLIKKRELLADKGAIDFGIPAQDGISYIRKYYDISAKKKQWPLYAKLRYIMDYLTIYRTNLFEEEDRIATLKKFEKERNNLKKDLRINPMAF